MAISSVNSNTLAVEGAVNAAITGRRVDVKGRVFEMLLVACLLVSLAVLAILLLKVVTDGAGIYGDRGYDFLDGALSSRASRAGISQGIVGSFWIAVSVIVVAVPLGVGAAIYLEEYAPRNR